MSPRPKSDRRFVGLRISEAGHSKIQEIADREGVSWSEAARRLLKWATSGQPMPKGWH